MENNICILIVDDDEQIASDFKCFLEKDDQYKVTVMTEAHGVVDFVREKKPDVVVLDVQLYEDDLAGFGICTELTEFEAYRNKQLHIIHITSNARLQTEAGEMVSLAIGAHNFLTKGSTTPRLLKAKIEALVRDRPIEGILYKDSRITINNLLRTIERDHQTFTPSKRQFDIVEMLAETPGKVVEKSTLLDKYFGQNAGEELLVREISTCRKLLDSKGDPSYLKSRSGVGYYFCPRERK